MAMPSQRGEARLSAGGGTAAGLAANLVRRIDRLALPEAALVSVTLAVPELAGLTRLPAMADPWSWQRPSEGLALIAWGCAHSVAPADTAGLAAAYHGLDWAHLDADAGGAEPVAFLGHGFGGPDALDFPPALLRVPLLVLRRRGERCELILSHRGGVAPARIRAAWGEALEDFAQALAAPPLAAVPVLPRRVEEIPSPALYRQRVRAATQAIAAGRLEKVVLSRRILVEASRPLRPERLVEALVERHPSCAILTAGVDGRTLVAASPERLVACQGRDVGSYALAGTAPSDPADPFLGGRLLSGAKDRHEHRLVVEWISEALGGLCETLDVPAAPRRMGLGRLEHLWTPITGRLKPGAGLLQAAARLHPTPAVAGLPLAEARAVLAELGETRAGWYSGAFGWIDRAGDGEMAVVLRCAVLDGDRALLSAGGGIVAASEPEAEFAETELKLGIMLEGLRRA
ncbi:isochorismate synthase [Phaeospirillum tilakii]|uniref:isochorismate synthase n=1 Tax=Phaeospirillum tilakii TaxID=741673 RepID=A0ABW5CDS7_9PROT